MLGGNGLSTITAAEFLGIMQFLKSSVSAQASSDALMESVVQTLLENRDLFGRGDMLVVLKLLLHTMETQGDSVILQPEQFARLLEVRRIEGETVTEKEGKNL